MASDKPSPTLYYIRHGETDWNAEGRVQGRRDIPLNALGRAQATRAGDILRDLLARDGHAADAIDFVASPLIRARVTMELVRVAVGLPADGYALDARLQEIHYGEWEGMTLPQMQQRDPGVFEMRGLDKWGVSPPQGETYAEVAVRVKEWSDSLSRDVVIVAHGGTMRALSVVLTNLAPQEAADFNVRQGFVYVFKDGAVSRHG